jgi:glucose-6-phosphate 1-dehydrogenase
VAPGSGTETYVALRLEIDNWRWADVPIFLRAGQALPHKVTEVRLLPHAPARLPVPAGQSRPQDSVEETWRIMQPLLDRPPGVRSYPRGSWGPDDAEALVRGHPRWLPPWLPAGR